MEPFRLHIFACEQRKPDGAPCCHANGSARVIDALRAELGKQGLAKEVQVTTCGSLGLCGRGPNMVVYPEGVWYSGVKPEDVPELVREHLAGGRVVERLLSGDQAAVRAEIDANGKRRLAALAARDKAGVLPDDLNATIRGFQESRVVLSAVELDVFSAVGSGADADAVAQQLGTALLATESLLNALVALELLQKQGATYQNTPVAARFLAAGGADDSRAAILHSTHMWTRWSTLTECLRQGTSVSWQEMETRGDDWTTSFIAAMHKNAAVRAPMVVAALGVERTRWVLDVGGGSGAYAIAFAKASEHVRADILDLASVLPITQRHIDEAGVAQRVHTRVGDLRVDALGEGYDLVFLSAICHMLSPDENRDLLKRAFAALSSGGRVVIQDFILNPDKTGPKIGALFALNMLVGTRAGSAYSEQEYGDWLTEVGLTEVHRIALAGPTELMVAERR